MEKKSRKKYPAVVKYKVRNLFEIKHFLRKAGKMPGEIDHEKPSIDRSVVELIEYNKETCHIKTVEDTTKLSPPLQQNFNSWIDVLGLTDAHTVQNIGNGFSIHNLTMEDVINTDHLPKCEITEKHLFFTLKFPVYDKENDFLKLVHISLIFSGQHLISLQEGQIDHFLPIKERIKNGLGKVRVKNIEYLFCILIDYIVDQYFYIMDQIRDSIENAEELLYEQPTEDHIQDIHLIKRRIVYLRKYISSLNQAIKVLLNDEMPFSDTNISMYIRDIHDHILHINESLITAKELQTTLLEMNMANVSNSMNKVMKTLTIVASIFIPLTFIVGIYGMNFHHMPELDWKYGYPATIGLSLIIATVMAIFMKRKKWF